MLTDKDINEFQEIHRKHFGKEISYEKAYDGYMKLLNLMEAIYKPMTKEGFEKLQKRREELGLERIKHEV